MIDERVAALRARRTVESSAPAAEALLTAPPAGVSVAMAPPVPSISVDGASSAPVRERRRRRYPAGRARIGVTVAAVAGFVAMVPVMGPLTSVAAPGDGDVGDDSSDDEVPSGELDATIELSTSTTTTTTTVDLPADSVPLDAGPTTTADPGAAPLVAPTVAATPAAPAPAPAPAPRPPLPVRLPLRYPRQHQRPRPPLRRSLRPRHRQQPLLRR